MVNKLLINWHMRTKYADDTTAFGIIPRKSLSMLVVVVTEIHDYCIEHKMKLNPKKCKEMYVNFMTNSITAMRPLSVGNQGVERVGSYKLLGVQVYLAMTLNGTLTLNTVIAKTAKRLYAIR